MRDKSPENNQVCLVYMGSDDTYLIGIYKETDGKYFFPCNLYEPGDEFNPRIETHYINELLCADLKTSWMPLRRI